MRLMIGKKRAKFKLPILTDPTRLNLFLSFIPGNTQTTRLLQLLRRGETHCGYTCSS